jgi:hypothetical protein
MAVAALTALRRFKFLLQLLECALRHYSTVKDLPRREVGPCLNDLVRGYGTDPVDAHQLVARCRVSNPAASAI